MSRIRGGKWISAANEPIDIISVWGPPRGGTGVADGAHLSVLDGSRKVVFVEESLRMDGPTQTIALSGDFSARVQNAAITSLASIRGREEETFGLLAGFIAQPATRQAAIAAIRRTPKANWPASQIAPLAQAMTAYIVGGARFGPHRRGVQAGRRARRASSRRACRRPRPRR